MKAQQAIMISQKVAQALLAPHATIKKEMI